MEPEEEKIETPAETTAPVEVPVADEVPVDDSAPAEERKPTPMPKPKEPKIPLPSSLQEIVGALLFASQTPLTITDLRQCIRGVEPAEGDNAEVMGVYQSCTTREVEQAVHGLEKELERAGCGFRLVCAGGAYRLQTAPTCGRYVRALLKLDRPNRLSRASLETLAIVAYRQPITKSEVEQIRGVAVDTIMKTLVDLQLVRLVGRSELPGHPFLYGTTPLFLEHFGLASLSELNAEKPKDEEPTLEDAARETAAASLEAGAPDGSDASRTPPETAASPAEDEEEDEPLTVARIGSTDDDDDIFIDDTPDEFDDDDEDDDDDFDDEEDEEEVETEDEEVDNEDS